MQGRLVTDYTTLFPEIKEGQDQPPKGMRSLYEVCQQVVDGREDGWAADNDPTVLNHFDALVDWKTIPLG
jgi:hypothetical protein